MNRAERSLDRSLDDASLNLENRPARRFIVLAKLCTRSLADMYKKKYKLTTTGWEILAIVGRYEPIFPIQVGQETTMESDRVSRTVEQLVEKGFVNRRSDSVDRRRVVLRLTAKGRSAYHDIDRVRRILDSELLKALDDEERAAFFSIMDKLGSRAQQLLSGKNAWKQIVADASRAVDH
ncbi:MAG: MarR family transcriptional regulator [Burkholderiales bacterium]|nr:MarR family transcriptional regulator [Burkholderiales bacterium]